MRDFLREYLDELEKRMERILSEQREMMDRAARMMADQIKADKLIYVFGSGGHSNMMAEEMFHRAGGLACVAPVFCEPVMLHEGAAESSRLEKLSGYAEKLKDMYNLESRDMMFIVSTSDKNAVPVEYAE